MRVASPLLFVLAAAAMLPAAASAQVPQRKAGWWDMTMSMSSPAPMKQKMQFCTDAATEKSNSALGDQLSQQGDCKSGPVTRSPTGWRFSSTCKQGGMTMASTGVASGDFNSNYRLETTTRMTPAPMPQMAETKMVMEAKWMGACPAGRKPGDMVMSNGMVVNTNRKK